MASLAHPIEQEDIDLVAPERLTPWLDAHLPALGDGPLRVRRLAGGATNAVFRLDRGGASVVLRRPPRRPRPDSDKIMSREARVLEALGPTDVPAPRLLALCEDRNVLGSVFYVMDLIDGWLCFGESPAPAPFDQAGPAKASLAFALIDGLARLALVDHQAVGLGDFGKPDGFLERQVDRWLGQLDSYRTLERYEPRDLPDLAYVADWLRANTPSAYRVGVMHGDYGFANVMFKREAPACIAAIIDWELCTIGDPFLDLAWTVAGFRAKSGEPASPAYFDPAEYPTREALVARYAEKTGRPVENLTYYLVLAQFKRAILLERQYARALNGAQQSALGQRFADTVVGLMHAAGAMARANS